MWLRQAELLWVQGGLGPENGGRGDKEVRGGGAAGESSVCSPGSGVAGTQLQNVVPEVRGREPASQRGPFCGHRW